MDVQFYIIGELAKRTGYSPAMIRYFEKVGVITPPTRTRAGYRLFGNQQVEELQFVREMQNLGFHAQHIKTLREIRQSDLAISEKRDRIGRVFQEHTSHIERRIAYYTGLKAKLESIAANFIYRVLADEPPD